ncbi:hypothetical protein [Reyranella sp. CPCC 100927]|uniref:hypothetical protein n=1 Tax=Reyranella sp. CPCC 100927 TaxID=2599616 RepID=UPI0011B6E116|nr:hypothetical protein [Reyranella sp. CPCC 100927]TWT12748.1 hypothetical protein FQU96_10850 [Reyranella sp. CPCC 100927]
MDRSDIRDAIQLFQYSRTAMAGGRAADVVRTLWRLEAAGEIGFADRGAARRHGGWREDREGFDLQVGINYIKSLPASERLGGLSLVLVHEGTHAAVNFTRLLDEMAARLLSIHYYRELIGPGVFNEANDPPRPGKPFGIVRLNPSRFESLRKQSDALKRDRLVDYILANKTYRKSSYVDAQWVVDHMSLWGGLANRLPATKGIYVHALAQSADRYHVVRILDILESINNRPDWDAMMAAAKRLSRLQLALDDLTTDRRLSDRIAALQRRWNVTLIEMPPVRR